MQPGVYSDLPAEAYHAAPGISVSFLKVLAKKCPAKARYGEHRETDALVRGTLLHCAILEPEHLELRYCATDLERAGTKAWDEAERQAGGRRLIKGPEMQWALRVRDAVMAHPTARELLTAPGPIEDSFWWTDPETQVLRRGRADKIARDMRVILDVKSTMDASPQGFGRQAEELLYDWQSASYIDGLYLAPGGFVPEAFVFLAIEKEPPFLVGIYETMPMDLDRARYQVGHAMETVARCLRTDVWPGYSQTVEPLRISGRADFRGVP